MVGVVSLLLIPTGGGATTPPVPTGAGTDAVGASSSTACGDAVQKYLNDIHAYGIGLRKNGVIAAVNLGHPLTPDQHEYVKVANQILDRDRIAAQRACGHRCLLNALGGGELSTLAAVGLAAPDTDCSSP